jgi:hypothetical protein
MNIEWARTSHNNTQGDVSKHVREPQDDEGLRGAVRGVMETLGVEYVADVTASDLTQNRGGFVLMRGGASLVAIHRILGHNSLNITQRYLDHLVWADLAQ